jgi:transposase
MPRSRPPYPPEFRAEAVELIRSGTKSFSQLSRDIGVSDQTLRNWVRQADLDAGRRHDGLTTGEREELRRLRAENRTLRMERDLLKKPRSSSPRRAIGVGEPGGSLQVHRRGEDLVPDRVHVPTAGRLLGWLLRVEAATAVAARFYRCAYHHADSSDSRWQPRYVRCAQNPRRTGR